MAENNLGQVSAIWLEDSPPPHTNVLWLKTINPLTSEKTGFIWNGIEWINIQGQSFYWKSDFDVNTDYTENDVVKFEESLYIKLNNTASNGGTPDVSSDFDLFLPTATPVGETGSVQLKDANGRFFGSNLLSFIAGIFSISGSFFLKSTSSSTGNAFELRNSNNANLKTYQNSGQITRNVNIPFQQHPANVQYVNTSSVTITETAGGTGTVQVIEDNKTINISQNIVAPKYYEGKRITMSASSLLTNVLAPIVAYRASFTGSNITNAAGFYSAGILGTGNSQGDNPSVINGHAYMSANTNIGLETNCYPQIGGIRKLLRLNRFFLTGSIPAGTVALNVGEGTEISFSGGVAIYANGIGQTAYNDAIQHRIAVLANADAPVTTELAFKTTQANVSVEPLLLTGKDVKAGYLDGKMGFYGKQPITKPSLPQNATAAEILTALENLGLIDIIIP